MDIIKELEDIAQAREKQAAESFKSNELIRSSLDQGFASGLRFAINAMKTKEVK